MGNYKKKAKVTVEDIEYADESIDDLAKAIVEDLKEHTNQLEPVEFYATRLRMKFHENVDKFCERVSKGYRLLLVELEKDILKK